MRCAFIENRSYACVGCFARGEDVAVAQVAAQMAASSEAPHCISTMPEMVLMQLSGLAAATLEARHKTLGDASIERVAVLAGHLLSETECRITASNEQGEHNGKDF